MSPMPRMVMEDIGLYGSMVVMIPFYIKQPMLTDRILESQIVLYADDTMRTLNGLPGNTLLHQSNWASSTGPPNVITASRSMRKQLVSEKHQTPLLRIYLME